MENTSLNRDESEKTIHDCTITLDEGVKLTSDWRTFIKENMESDEKQISRGAFVKLEDLQELIKFHAEQTEDFVGVRIYFALKKHDENDPHEKSLHHVKIVLVPVVSKDKEHPENGEDVLEINAPDSADAAISTIYDFTRPCPPFCGPPSKLY